MKVTHHITTNMRGFQQWMRRHPRKRTDGFFSFNGKELKHEQIKRIVDYAVEKGYRTDADIPGEEILKLLSEWNVVQNIEDRVAILEKYQNRTT